MTTIAIDVHDRICQDLHQQIRSLIVENEKLRAALAEPPTNQCGETLQVESAVAEIATTQQQLDNKLPSDYRRGYWDGFAIGKREGRIEAEDALAEPVQEPVAYSVGRTLHWHEGRGVNDAQLYLAPPQRKPLTEEEITQCFKEAGITIKGQHWTNAVRNVERAHGIGGQP